MNACNQCIEKKMTTSFSPSEHIIHTKLISECLPNLLSFNHSFTPSSESFFLYFHFTRSLLFFNLPQNGHQSQHTALLQAPTLLPHPLSRIPPPSRKPSLTLSTPVLCAGVAVCAHGAVCGGVCAAAAPCAARLHAHTRGRHRHTHRTRPQGVLRWTQRSHSLFLFSLFSSFSF